MDASAPSLYGAVVTRESCTHTRALVKEGDALERRASVGRRRALDDANSRSRVQSTVQAWHGKHGAMTMTIAPHFFCSNELMTQRR